MSQFSHINVNIADLTFYALTCFLFLTFMKEWTSPQHWGGTSASVAPIDFPFPGHSRGRMMHSLRDADCYSCRCAVPLRKGGAYRWHHGAPWSAVRMSQVNVGRMKVTAFLMLRNKIVLRWGHFLFGQHQNMSKQTEVKLYSLFHICETTDNPTGVAGTHLPYQNTTASALQLDKKEARLKHKTNL